MIERQPPYAINRTIDRFARRIWFTHRVWYPAVVMRATARVAELKRRCEARGVSVNAAFLKAMATALAEFPRLNYYAVRGRMVWGGAKSSVSIVVEKEPFETCHHIRIEDAEQKTLEAIQKEIVDGLAKPVPAPGPAERFMNAFPLAAYFLKLITGRVADEVMRNCGVAVLTNVNNPGIDEVITAGVYFTTILSPGTIRDGRMPLCLSFNHELANARPVAAYLARVKELLEQAEL